MKTNVLYYGDNLEILKNRDYFPDACIDLIYDILYTFCIRLSIPTRTCRCRKSGKHSAAGGWSPPG